VFIVNSISVLNPLNQKPIGDVVKTEWAMLDSYLQQASDLHKDKCQHLAAHQSIVEKLAMSLAEQLVVGDASDINTGCGPMIRPAECKRVGEWVEEARNSGAKILCGGQALSESLYTPTVIYNPDESLKVSQLEIFGPVVCLYSYDEIDEAFAKANNVAYSFQASVFTNDLDVALTAQHKLEASAVMVNDHTAFRVDWMPFAGRKQSGYNVGGIAYTMHDMSEEKMVVVKLPNNRPQ
jgi:acyl-CoA reductase-like NAD-dependent aldehyde dehydrogenase